jgi:hypothetical protein
MQSLIESAAEKAGVPSEALDLVGRDFISQIAQDLPNLLLPPIMSTIRQEFLQNGLNWMKEDLLIEIEMWLKNMGRQSRVIRVGRISAFQKGRARDDPVSKCCIRSGETDLKHFSIGDIIHHA